MAWRPFRCSAFRRRLFPSFLASRADSCAVEKDDDEGTVTKDNDEQVIASLTVLEVIQSALPVLEAAVRGRNVEDALEWGAGEVGRAEVVRGVAGLLLLQQTRLGRVPIRLGLPLVAMTGGGELEIGS
jgi:hypothetical protein